MYLLMKLKYYFALKRKAVEGMKAWRKGFEMTPGFIQLYAELMNLENRGKKNERSSF